MTSSGSVAGDERLRLVLGFRLPDATARSITRWQREELGAPEHARLVPEENLHVTIAFLGSRPFVTSNVGFLARNRERIIEGVG